MLHRSFAVAAAALLFVVPRPAAAQQEVQVALDEEGRVEVVDARLAQRLGLFVDRYPGFQEARLFLVLPDSTYVLEVTRVHEDRTVRERVPLAAAEAAELRRDVAERIGARAPAVGLDQEGRARLLGGTALMGLAFYGWAVPTILDVDEPRTEVALYMLTAGASFFGPWIATRDRTVTRSMADLGFYGATRGAIHGLLLHEALAGETASARRERTETAAALIGSIGGAVAGYWWARDGRLDLADARTIGLGGDAGLLYGLGTAHLVDAGSRAAAGLAVAGSGAGLAIGRALADRRPYAPGDVSVLTTGGLLGAYTAIAVMDWTGTERSRAYTAAAMAGGLAGFTAADRLVRHTDFPEGQGRLIGLGTVAGGLVGLGLAYLVTGDEADDATLFLTASSLGALAGFAVTYGALAPVLIHAVRGRYQSYRKPAIDNLPASRGPRVDRKMQFVAVPYPARIC
jgi:hypothetical protein